MSKHGKRDLLIHFDEEKNDLVFFTVEEDSSAKIRATEFDGARIDVPHFKDMFPDEAERTLGETAFSLIDTFANDKIGIRDYETLNEERHRKYVADMESEAIAGDAEAQYMLFIEYHSRALFNSDAQSLKKAEEMLELAAAGGYEDAISSLENNWAQMRAAVERKIKRGPAA